MKFEGTNKFAQKVLISKIEVSLKCTIRGISVKKAPPHIRKPPPFRYMSEQRGGLSYMGLGRRRRKFGDFGLKMMIFIRENVLERCKNAIFPPAAG